MKKLNATLLIGIILVLLYVFVGKPWYDASQKAAKTAQIAARAGVRNVVATFNLPKGGKEIVTVPNIKLLQELEAKVKNLKQQVSIIATVLAGVFFTLFAWLVGFLFLNEREPSKPKYPWRFGEEPAESNRWNLPTDYKAKPDDINDRISKNDYLVGLPQSEKKTAYEVTHEEKLKALGIKQPGEE